MNPRGVSLLGPRDLNQIKPKMKSSLPLILLLVLAFAIPDTADAAKPRWVKKRPSGKDYYVGMGMAYKAGDQGRDYARQARSKALKELASEIEVSVSANSLLQQFEDNYAFRETFRSETATAVEQNLKGYEVQTWENKREYWVMLRLNKADYNRRKQQDLEMAKKTAASWLNNARQHLEEQDVTNALASYFKAIQALENHLEEDLTHRTAQGTIHFGTDIMKELQALFSKITITPDRPVHSVEFSKNLELPLILKVLYLNGEGRAVPVKSFPLEFRFSMGEGLLQGQPVTNPNGEARCYIQKLISRRKKQEVTATFDYSSFLKRENVNSPLVSFFIPAETVPRASISIELSKAKAELTANETIFESSSSTAPFTNQLKSELNNLFFNFSSQPGEAEYQVKLNAIFKKGEVKKGIGYSVYLVYADLYFSIVSTQNKTEIFNEAILNEKGMRPGSYDYALKEARQKLLDRFNGEIVPKLEVLDL